MVALQKEQDSTLSPMDRNSAWADRFVQSQVNLEKIVETAKPLYASLDGAQKHKFIAVGSAVTGSVMIPTMQPMEAKQSTTSERLRRLRQRAWPPQEPAGRGPRLPD